jgi:hypothetical protein
MCIRVGDRVKVGKVTIGVVTDIKESRNEAMVSMPINESTRRYFGRVIGDRYFCLFPYKLFTEKDIVRELEPSKNINTHKL